MPDNKNLLIPESIDQLIINLLGPTSKTIGEDINKLYLVQRNKLLLKAAQKAGNLKDGKVANLRVTRDVLWNGSYSENEIATEYFAGVLASSRTTDGKDDSAIFFLDIIKSLSSEQLNMHYVIYSILNKLFSTEPPRRIFPMTNNAELSMYKIYIPQRDLFKNKSIHSSYIIFGLYSKGLIGDFHTKSLSLENQKDISILEIEPTTLGIQLYCIAHNQFNDWLNFPNLTFDQWNNIEIPLIFGSNKDSLLKKLQTPAEQIEKDQK